MINSIQGDSNLKQISDLEICLEYQKTNHESYFYEIHHRYEFFMVKYVNKYFNEFKSIDSSIEYYDVEQDIYNCLIKSLRWVNKDKIKEGKTFRFAPVFRWHISSCFNAKRSDYLRNHIFNHNLEGKEAYYNYIAESSEQERDVFEYSIPSDNYYCVTPTNYMDEMEMEDYIDSFTKTLNSLESKIFNKLREFQTVKQIASELKYTLQNTYYHKRIIRKKLIQFLNKKGYEITL